MDKKNYLDISKASDLKDKKEIAIYRAFETIPGIVSCGTLLGVFVFSWILPSWVAIFIICFCFYYLFRIVYFSLHQIASYFRVKKHLKTDWMARLKKIKNKNWKKIYHLIILP